MKKLIAWLKKVDNGFFPFLTAVYVFFIPIFPKIPLKPVSYTYIAIRPDDVFLALYIAVFVIQLLRKKLTLNRQFTILFVLFWAAVFLSLAFNMFLTRNLPYRQVAFLNALRRVQYMLPFLAGLAVVKSEKDFFHYLKLTFIALFIVSVYGIGQKFLGWPAIQTMNPEYSRGHLLILTPEARVSSTFAGHYDLAAYLIMLLPIIYSFYLFRKNLTYLFLFIISLFTLILTASRVSFGAYLISIVGFFIFVKKYKQLFFVLLLTALFTFMNNNLTSRIKRTFQIKRIFVNEKTGQVVIPQKSTSKELPAGSFYIPIKQTGKVSQTQMISDQNLATAKILDDMRWEASRSGKKLTASDEAKILASISAGLTPVNTVISDISLATRLQVEWPRAIKAFLSNPILGTGPYSITEATDNDYLRWLGEIGLLGAGIFIYILFLLIKTIYLRLNKTEKNKQFIYFGYLFGFLGLLVNAGWIDVFEASKVAYCFWMLAAFYVGPFLNLKYGKK